MHKLLCAVFLGLMAVSCAQNQRAQPAGSSASGNDPSTSANDPSAPAGASAGSSKETGDTQARRDNNPADKAPKY
jgi:hypothetical protein